MLDDSGNSAQVLNGGVGNYNAERYVSRFFKELTPLNPTDIVVHYFLRDAGELPPGGGNVLLRHSELAVTLWIAYHRLLDKHGEASLLRAAYISACTILRRRASKSCRRNCANSPTMPGATTSASTSP